MHLQHAPRTHRTFRNRSSALCNMSSHTCWQRAHRRPVTTSVHVAQVQQQLVNVADETAEALTRKSKTSTSSSSSSSDVSYEGFTWSSYWYPVHVLESVDPSRPHPIELLGRQLVLWRDGQGKWQCMEDACPHRLAPLSEGRIERGTLMCSYHGWRFTSEGKCVEIPQALDEKAKAVACSSSRSCVVTYPVKEEYGLIWVWPSAGPIAEAEAAAAPLPLSKGVVAAAESGQPLKWYRRELPYSWDILIENLTDPSHLPFSHHNLMPSMKRENGVAMPFTPVELPTGDSPEAAAARPGYSFAHKSPIATFEFPSALSQSGRVCFHPPSAVVYEYVLNSMGPYLMQNDLLAVPAGPGRSVAYTLGTGSSPKVTNLDIFQAFFTNPKSLPMLMLRAYFQRRPTFQAHLLSNKLFDQDNVFLAMQDRQIALRGKDNWVRDYYMPTPCDGLVIAARKWATKALKLKIPAAASSSDGSNNGKGAGGATAGPTAAELFSLSAEAAAGTPRPTPREINDRYKQHTQHCILCQKELKHLQQKLKLAQAAAAAMLAGLIGVVAAGVLPALLPQSTAPAAAAAAGGVGLPGLGPVAVVAGVLAVGAAVAARVAAATSKVVEQFVYVEFSHATNH